MPFLVLAALFALLPFTCGAVVIAVEARRLCEGRRFWVALACSIPLAAAMVALIVAGERVRAFDPRTSDHFGFDPGWHCVTSGGRGASFCYREPAEGGNP